MQIGTALSAFPAMVKKRASCVVAAGANKDIKILIGI